MQRLEDSGCLPRPAPTRLGSTAAASLLGALLCGRRAADSVRESTLIDLCCHGVFDHVLAQQREAARDRMRRRYEEIFHHTIVGVFEDCADGSRGRVPTGFYVGDQGVTNCAIMVRHIIEEVLGIAEQDVPARVDGAALRRPGLVGAFAMVFRSSVWAAIEAAYPGRYKPWELRHAPQGIWQGKRGRERGVEATRWLFETRLGVPVDEIATRTDEQVFEANGLIGMLNRVYGSSPFRAIDAAYPGRFRPWQTRGAPKGYWRGPRGRSHAIAATRWLVEDRLAWSDEEIGCGLSREVFSAHGLGTLIHARYHGSVLSALAEAYPGRFRASDLRSADDKVRDHREMHDRAVASVRWLVEDALGWSHDLVGLLLSRAEFRAFGLDSMVKCAFGSSVSRALEEAYPDRYPRGHLSDQRYAARLRDPFYRPVFTAMRMLLDAARNEAATCKRWRLSAERLAKLRTRFASEGVRALLPAPRENVPLIDAQLAVRALTYRKPQATAQDISSELRRRGTAVSPDAVEEIWRSHGLLAPRERYRLAAAATDDADIVEAARALGVTAFRLRYNRTMVKEGGFEALCAPIILDGRIESAILDVVRQDASLGRTGLLQALRERGTPATEHAVDIVLSRFRIRTVPQRVAAGGGLPSGLRELVALEPQLRRLVRGPRASCAREVATPRPWWGRDRAPR